MDIVALSDNELDSIRVGEAITLAAVLAILAASIITVVVYKLFTSSGSTVKLPGGYQFTW